jgi:hypothetical protein
VDCCEYSKDICFYKGQGIFLAIWAQITKGGKKKINTERKMNEK